MSDLGKQVDTADDGGRDAPTFRGKRGSQLLRDAHLNRSTAFTDDERDRYGLVGLLPEGVESVDRQVDRVVAQLEAVADPLGKYVALTNLLDRDETLFYRVLMSDPVRYMPIVYTPTVGDACLRYDQLLRRPRGMYLAATRAGQLADVLRNWHEPGVRFIVVTDGERILGLGDLGANGMGIPIGKLALYTACAGVPPELTLPVLLDVGTNNEALLDDPLYLGIRQHRLTGAAYDGFIDEFVDAVQEVFPGACIQFEDFAQPHAAPLLARYRDQVCCFNDDIQGTAAVALAGLLAALRVTGGDLADQRILFLGAGSAAVGIAGLLAETLELEGVDASRARRCSWLFDVNGLVVADRTDLNESQLPYAHDHVPIVDFVEAIRVLRPTAIIGVSTMANGFDQQVIESMAELNERPIIFPLSNPTSHAECTAEQAYRWSDGRAVVATGSPFGPVRVGDRTYVPGQGNNVFIFPAVGLAIMATRATRVTDETFIEAARALADHVTLDDLDEGLVYPPLASILSTSKAIAARVARSIIEQGHAGIETPADLDAHIASITYHPDYTWLDVTPSA